MGQYYGIYNKTKKEMIHPHRFDDGVKLLEFGTSLMTPAALCVLLANSNGRGGGDLNVYPEDYDKPTLLEQLNIERIKNVAGRWAGDEIVIQGDYAEEGDPGYIPEAELEQYEDISERCLQALLIDGYIKQTFLGEEEA